ncbi:SDR family NAD(P)-dependent oxidoreductase [Spirosoma flavum]|uniref:SDR family NAD(P)-dependent oxidoreductase n=1 Tax=Spirosoma flavum TaxID=2048557 RepID=A0ABW6AI92_9BACT
METSNNGKTALITGASSGIGRELTRLFAKDGYNLVLVGRDSDALQLYSNNLQNQYGTQVTLIQKDLANPSAPTEIYAETTGQGLQIDVLVNNAGFGEYGMFATETDIQKELGVVQVNAVALMHLTKLYLKDMVSRNEGKILMLGSEASVAPNPMMAVYGATKAFIKSFSEAIRNELNDTNITVTVLMPGATNTDFFKVAGATEAKGADPNKTADPAAVAKEGYDALMSGKDHVVAGWMNKARVAMAHVLPDPLVAASARRDMMPKEQAEQQQKQTLTIALAVSVAVLSGWWLLSRSRSPIIPSDIYSKARSGRKSFHAKASQAGHSTRKALASVSDSVQEAYQQAKSAVV